MREELRQILSAIEQRRLPMEFAALFEANWDDKAARFTAQETYILDYKEKLPERFTDAYGAGIVRLALAFHNSFGGLIVFGVKDRALTVTGVGGPFDVEAFDRVLSDFTGVALECLMRVYSIPHSGSGARDIAVVLVPRRAAARPVRLRKDLGPYTSGMTWIRDRHEALEAGINHLPTLYSERRLLPSEADEVAMPFAIQQSFPPSPSTIRDFVGRGRLVEALFEWFLFDDQPRMYLHGPGGSGKSTLAFEIARLLADNAHMMRLPRGERIDYIVFLSGKETEFNPLTGHQQEFALRQFGSAREQMVQILHHTGLATQDEVAEADEGVLEARLAELFDSYNGLLVVDDIDALSRRKVDTGEEALFVRAVRGSRWTRVLYTLRYPPAHAVRSSLTVPRLDPETEVPTFIDACCRQFEVPAPSSDQIPPIVQSTDCLPLLLETVIGLRKHVGGYQEAVAIFTERGGDDARRYLYQREYDQLETGGRSKTMLAALLLLGEPVSFGILVGLFRFPAPQVADALSEAGSIFLSTFENEAGETLYQLVPPCVPFVRMVSARLEHFSALRTTVENFRSAGSRATPREAALIVAMERNLRESQAQTIAETHAAMPPHDPVLANPKVRALLAQGYAELGQRHRADARDWFRAAEDLGYRDTFMMRRWYNLEIEAGDHLGEAERICRSVIDDKRFGTRYRSEFLSKLGRCLLLQANSLGHDNQDRVNVLIRRSCVAYLDALWTGRNVRDFDLGDTRGWLERPLGRLVRLAADDAEQFYLMLEEVASCGHDLHPDGAEMLVEYLLKLRIPHDRGAYSRAIGLCARTSGRISRFAKPTDNYPVLTGLIRTLETLRTELEAKRPTKARTRVVG